MGNIASIKLPVIDMVQLVEELTEGILSARPIIKEDNEHKTYVILTCPHCSKKGKTIISKPIEDLTDDDYIHLMGYITHSSTCLWRLASMSYRTVLNHKLKFINELNKLEHYLKPSELYVINQEDTIANVVEPIAVTNNLSNLVDILIGKYGLNAIFIADYSHVDIPNMQTSIKIITDQVYYVYVYKTMYKI
jgi:hypothetical protein